MGIQKNSIVILKPLKQIPEWENINMDVYNKYKGKLLSVVKIFSSPFRREKYVTYRLFYSNYIQSLPVNEYSEFTGPDGLTINLKDGI